MLNLPHQVHLRKVYGGTGGIAPHILNLRSGWREQLTHTGHLASELTQHLYLLFKKLGGVQCWFGCSGGELSVADVNQTQFAGHQYADRAMKAVTNSLYQINSVYVPLIGVYSHLSSHVTYRSRGCNSVIVKEKKKVEDS